MVNIFSSRRGLWRWPSCCVVCGAAGTDQDLCAGCYADLPWIEQACQRCALPLPRDGVCGPCLRQPPAYDRCRSALWYAPPASLLLTAFKHRGRLACGRVLGELLAQCLPASLAVDALVPVPLHWRRRWQRGYNQAAELAHWLSRAHGIPVLTAISRCRPTPPQQGLSAAARSRNLHGAFRLRRPVQGLRLALVDDVITTGRTGSALATLLQRNGAQRVELWSVARTLPPAWQP